MGQLRRLMTLSQRFELMIACIHSFFPLCRQNSQRHGHPAHYKRPQPVRPAPKPPASKYVTSGKPTVEVKGGNHHLKSTTETIIQVYDILNKIMT